MTRRSSRVIWMSLSDLLLCVLNVVIVAVSPVKAKTDGAKSPALYLISMEWDTTLDIDPDLWVITPDGPVYYSTGNRQIGPVSLDQDNRGWSDDGIGPDGERVRRAREITTIRGVKHGHYDIGANLYNYRQQSGGPPSDHVGLSVHIVVTKMDPVVSSVFESDVTLDKVKKTINVASFDMDDDGKIIFVKPPIEPITAQYVKDSH